MLGERITVAGQTSCILGEASGANPAASHAVAGGRDSEWGRAAISAVRNE